MDLDDKKSGLEKMKFKENIEEKIKEWKYVREIEISLIYVNAIKSNITADLG